MNKVTNYLVNETEKYEKNKIIIEFIFCSFFSNFLEIFMNFPAIYKLPGLLLKLLTFSKLSKPVNTMTNALYKSILKL